MVNLLLRQLLDKNVCLLLSIPGNLHLPYSKIQDIVVVLKYLSLLMTLAKAAIQSARFMKWSKYPNSVVRKSQLQMA